MISITDILNLIAAVTENNISSVNVGDYSWPLALIVKRVFDVFVTSFNT